MRPDSRELSLQIKILVEMLKRFGAHKSGIQLEFQLVGIHLLSTVRL